MSDAPRAGFLGVGQAAARAIALRSAERGRLHRTLLVHGPRGSGTERFVDDLLALLLCAAHGTDRPCNACSGCRGARARTHPDLVIGSAERWREMKGSGESLVAVARRWLGESAGAPVVAERRILLVDGVDRAGEPIQNALLKALEEPGPRQMFVLVADDVSLLLPTIRSRSQPLRMEPVPRAELAAWLMDHEALPADTADLLARISGGRSEAAIEMARDADLTGWRRRTQQELLVLLDRGPADRLAALRELLDEAARRAAPGLSMPGLPMESDASDDPAAARTPPAQQRAGALLLAEVWAALARDLLVIAGGQQQLSLGSDVLDGAEAAARRAGIGPLAAFLRVLARVEDGLAVSAAPKLATEVAMLAWPRVQERAAVGTPR